MTAPSGRRPAQRPDLPKAPSSGHPARRAPEDAAEIASTPAQPARNSSTAGEELVNFGARIPISVRRRARLYSVTHDVELQDVLAAALTEYLDRHEQG